MKVSDWLQAHPGRPVLVEYFQPINAALRALLSVDGLRDIYVTDCEGKMVGHISHKRLAELVFTEHRPAHSRRQLLERVSVGTVEEFMSRHFDYAQPDEELDDVVARQIEHELEDMPVMVDDDIVGTLNLTDLIRHFAAEELNNERG